LPSWNTRIASGAFALAVGARPLYRPSALDFLPFSFSRAFATTDFLFLPVEKVAQIVDQHQLAKQHD
jgi:hypothetical protein